MKRTKRLARTLIPVMIMAMLLSACRSSPVLEEITYTTKAEEIDYEEEMLDPEDEGEEDEQFQEEEDDEVETERDMEETQGVEDEEEDDEETDSSVEIDLDVTSSEDTSASTTSDTTAQTEESGTSDSDSTDTEDDTEESDDDEVTETPSSSTADTDEEEEDTTTDSGSSSDDDEEEEEPDTSNSDDVDEEPEEEETTTSASNTSDTSDTEDVEATPVASEDDTVRTYKQVVDATGSTVEVPDDVGTVTAVGAAAQMVEMLGGSGRLIGTNSDLLSSSLAQTAFSDYSSINSWWSGDGSSAITDSSFSALLAAAPDVCFEISGQNTFTDSQVQQLEDAGIAYFVLPALTSVENLENAVTLVAEVLGTSSDGTDCTTIATQYNNWVDGVVSSVSSATSGNELTSLYVVGWDSSATYTLNNTPDSIASSGSGLAYAYSPAKNQLISTFMSVANVTNESTRQSGYGRSNYVYLTPMFHQFTPTISGSAASYYAGTSLATPYDLFVAYRISNVYYQLGGSSYPAIIVSDSSVKSEIENNWFWQYHEADSDGRFYPDETSNTWIYTAVVYEYDIYVNPSGMVDWAEGSLESPLEAYWVAYEFYGSYTLDQVKSQTSSFYETFFGVTLSSSQLTAIFGE